MPRLISCAMTWDAILERRKTVTRRMGWAFLRVGDILQPVSRTPRAGAFERGPLVRVTSIRFERVDRIDAPDVAREGLDCTADEFVQRFCTAMKCRPDQMVARIEWEYL